MLWIRTYVDTKWNGYVLFDKKILRLLEFRAFTKIQLKNCSQKFGILLQNMQNIQMTEPVVDFWNSKQWIAVHTPLEPAACIFITPFSNQERVMMAPVQ